MDEQLTEEISAKMLFSRLVFPGVSIPDGNYGTYDYAAWVFGSRPDHISKHILLIRELHSNFVAPALSFRTGEDVARWLSNWQRVRNTAAYAQVFLNLITGEIGGRTDFKTIRALNLVGYFDALKDLNDILVKADINTGDSGNQYVWDEFRGYGFVKGLGNILKRDNAQVTDAFVMRLKTAALKFVEAHEKNIFFDVVYKDRKGEPVMIENRASTDYTMTIQLKEDLQDQWKWFAVKAGVDYVDPWKYIMPQWYFRDREEMKQWQAKYRPLPDDPAKMTASYATEDQMLASYIAEPYPALSDYNEVNREMSDANRIRHFMQKLAGTSVRLTHSKYRVDDFVMAINKLNRAVREPYDWYRLQKLAMNVQDSVKDLKELKGEYNTDQVGFDEDKAEERLDKEKEFLKTVIPFDAYQAAVDIIITVDPDVQSYSEENESKMEAGRALLHQANADCPFFEYNPYVKSWLCPVLQMMGRRRNT